MKIAIVGLIDENPNNPNTPAKSDHICKFMKYFSKNYDPYLFSWENFKSSDNINMFSHSKKQFYKRSMNDMDVIFVKELGHIHNEKKKFLEFLNVLGSLDSLVINNPATMKANLDKKYLIDLQKKKIPCNPYRQCTASQR